MNKKILKDYSLIVLGDLLLAAAVASFWEPSRIVTGGVSGIGIILRDYTGRAGFNVPLWATNIVLNIPLFILSFKKMSRDFFVKTAFAAAFLSVALYLASFAPRFADDILLAALFGGVSGGLGLGLVFRAMATTGGTDLAAGILHAHVFKHYSIARILFVIDSSIILLGFFAFGPVAAMYSVIAVFVCTRVSDALLEGLSFSKAAIIISNESEKIAQAVIERMDRGATGLYGKGMFTKKDKNILLCVVSAKELVHLKSIAREADAGAFVVVADVREVLGEGFSEM